ncbi:MAG TPA: LuxR C-terminal-related transcriptional regulator [Gaiellaceae bacterium]|nr:LuxR C-terminal-related transcriptional regulator [Gaiellaceae bacterium]
MPELPTGTVTFLFADVEGSTALQEDPQVDYAGSVILLRRILRHVVSAHGGAEADAVGDEYVAVFADPRAGAEAAFAAQREMRDATWPSGAQVRIRIGVHVGTPELGDEGYTGVDVVRASRIANAGHGGQIVVSDDLLRHLDGTPSRDLGEHRLAGLARPERIHQLLADDLPRDFPPLRNTISMLGAGITVVLADDTVLLREGIARLLGDAGFDVVAQSGTPDDLLRHVAMHSPTVAVVDIRMPPTHTDEGLRAAAEIRAHHPGTGVLVLSQYVEAAYAMDLFSKGTEGLGYLLKDRVSDVAEFASALRRVAEGGSALDPAVVAELFGTSRQGDPLRGLTPREREVLELMAEGRSNQAIADRLYVTPRAVEKHVTSIFSKLDLPATTDDHRRVLAVLAFLRT